MTGEPSSVGRHDVGAGETARANRAWWDAEAVDYYAEHGRFLGDDAFVWGPEGWTEAELGLLGPVEGRDILEVGAGAAQCSRWLASRGARVVASDLSAGMLRTARALSDRMRMPVPLLQCDARSLPVGDATFDVVFTAYGVIPFVADSDRVLAEAARVLRPGGRLVFSTSHPVRWAFPDDPGERGLTVSQSYFDTTPYVESDETGRATYVEHHRTLGERVREIRAAGLVLEDIVEPGWPERTTESWGGWSALRGRLLPGTAIFVASRP